MPKPPFFSQTFPYSCVPACLRMILASLDFKITEPEIRNLCVCDETGTSPSNAVKAAIKCGFDAYHANLVFEELRELVYQDITPIVFVRISDFMDYSHALVIYKISESKIYFLDPERGEQETEIIRFLEQWSRGLTIVVETKLEAI